ncbi:hypothetical protein EYB26_005426 [Talaromyces marneffei]|uniref:uncharacterized protein n=1 Tax=Talaromyces marneffei TaxID=37727 RepID=UPI0012A8C207|nr:uncharacterized protein EYB26_005426 [Talaromyces marneffei]QGA17750.1 hypothetical protein EYB26_005426 [Talaromyces marneffei]
MAYIAILVSPCIERFCDNVRNCRQRLVETKRYQGSLQAGYEALDIMHAAAHGDSASMSRITQIVHDIESRPKQKRNQARIPTTLGLREKKRAENIAFQRQTMYRHPDAEPILSRPRHSVAGQRHIPILVTARGVPFLRIKKPQPQNLSRIIRHKLRFKDKLVERRDRLLIDTLFAKDEEDWDRLVEGQPVTAQVIKAHQDLPWVGGTWLESPLQCYKKAFYDNIEFEKKQQALAEKMWEVVLAERKLAAEEEARKMGAGKPPSLVFWRAWIQNFRKKLLG